ncbi:MAG TPA: rhodanese-like domain-containing protein [Actinomycetota bacterium]|nr:rhodanese-like domain-containing protein [Actinomycetota bacterium]
MDAKQAAAALDGMQVLDVREYYEWAAGHVAGAKHIPLRMLPARFEEIDRDVPVLVTCQIGQRSGIAADFLRDHGYDAHNLEGGVEDWIAQGFSLVDVSDEPGAVVDGWAQTLD